MTSIDGSRAKLSLEVGTTIVGGTAGSVLFVGSDGTITQDNSKFYWDDSNDRLRVGNNFSSTYTLSVQKNATSTWLEILNNGGAGKGAFFGMSSDRFDLYNYQAGSIRFFTHPLVSTGSLRLEIDNSGKFDFQSNNLVTGGDIKGASFSVGSKTLNIDEFTNLDGIDQSLKTTDAPSFATGVTIGNLTLADGSITDSGGSISFGDESITTTGVINADGGITSDDATDTVWGIENQNLLDKSAAETIEAAWTMTSGTTIGNLTLADGSITDSSGTISFNDENITTTGTGTVNSLTVTAGTIDSPVANTGTAFAFDGTVSRSTGDLAEFTDNSTSRLRINESGHLVLGDGCRLFTSDGADDTSYGNFWGKIVSAYNISPDQTQTFRNAHIRNTYILSATYPNSSYFAMDCSARVAATANSVSANTTVGGNFQLWENDASNTGMSITNAYGGYFSFRTSGAGTITFTNGASGNFHMSGDGTNKTITTFTYMRTQNTLTRNATITNMRGLHLIDMTLFNSTTADAIRIDSQSNNGGAGLGNINMLGGNWNTGHIQLKDGHIWFDDTDNVVKMKGSAPTGESDGIGFDQTAANTNTPSGATAKQLEFYAEDGTKYYIPAYSSAW